MYSCIVGLPIPRLAKTGMAPFSLLAARASRRARLPARVRLWNFLRIDHFLQKTGCVMQPRSTARNARHVEVARACERDLQPMEQDFDYAQTGYCTTYRHPDAFTGSGVPHHRAIGLANGRLGQSD